MDVLGSSYSLKAMVRCTNIHFNVASGWYFALYEKCMISFNENVQETVNSSMCIQDEITAAVYDKNVSVDVKNPK